MSGHDHSLDGMIPSTMITVEEHLATVLAAISALPGERVALAEAAGRTLVAPVHARLDIPAFANSAMDGFAVRFADVAGASATAPVTLRVIADLPAGSDLDPAIATGEAVRIMTGSPVPTAADTIVPFEATAGGLDDSLETAVVRQAPRALGAHVRGRADDVALGAEVLPAGIRLGALQRSAAAAAAVIEVEVSPRPRVAIISTGSELAGPESLGGPDPLPRGMIPESNGILLASLATEADAEVVLQARVTDELGALADILDSAVALGADVVIMSGGVSAGAYEIVKATLGPSGAMAFSSVAMQPGKPQGFGRLPDGGSLLFGLPGNPVSSAVSFEIFVRPALLKLQSRTELHRPSLRLRAGVGWRTPPRRRQILPAAIDRSDPAGWLVRPATSGGSGSHLAGGLGRAEAYAIVAADVEAVEPGDLVDVMLVP